MESQQESFELIKQLRGVHSALNYLGRQSTTGYGLFSRDAGDHLAIIIERLEKQKSMSEMVTEFHEKQGLKEGLIRQDQLDKMKEEYVEFGEAITSGVKQRIAHELADLIYVAVGIAVVSGIEIEPVFAEVHKANMTKGPGFDKSVYVPPGIKI